MREEKNLDKVAVAEGLVAQVEVLVGIFGIDILDGVAVIVKGYGGGAAGVNGSSV